MSDTPAFDPFMPMTELAEKIQQGTISPTTAVETYLTEIDHRDDEIQAFVTVTDEQARTDAEQAENNTNPDERGPLYGVPVALKDLRDMKEGVPHSFGSKLVADMEFRAPRTNVVVQRLEEAGAIVLGKTNTPEFGHKGTTDNNVIGPTASPIDTDYNAGGSSGGSAAAVAAGMAPVATGGDAGGSIRIPAAACGVYGHKPSFGLIPIDSRPNAFGLKTHHSVAGALTRTVEDAAMVLDILAGPHPRDPSSVPVEMDFQGALDQSMDDLQIGYSPDLDVFPVEDPVEEAIDEATAAFVEAGATVEEITIDHGLSIDELTDAIETTFSTSLVGLAEILREEFGADLRDFPGIVSESLLQLLEIGDEKTVPDVAATGLVRTQFFDAIQDHFEEYDLLVTPTVGTTGMELEADRGLDWELALTWPFNWTGHPASSVPAQFPDEDRPAGMQIIGQQYDDETVLAASAAFERQRPWQEIYPR